MARRELFGDVLLRTLVTSAIASAASGATLMMLSAREGRAPMRPINATLDFMVPEPAASAELISPTRGSALSLIISPTRGSALSLII